MPGGLVKPLEIDRVVKAFAIIGTRDPDVAQAQVAYRLAWAIVHLGQHFVHTGAAYGIDQRAMEGTSGKNLKVFLPWSTYNTNIIPDLSVRVVYDPSIHRHWTSSVNRYHPAANRLSRGAFALHARNYGIVEGVSAVVALPREDGEGGTGQGIRIAKSLNIPVIQINRGSITDMPRLLGRTLQQLGLVDPNLKTTILGKQV